MGSTRGRIPLAERRTWALALGSVVAVVVVGVSATTAWLRRPEGPSDAVRAAAQQVETVPGVRRVDLDYVPRPDGWLEDGTAMARLGVVLDGGLEPDAAATAASHAVQTWYDARPFTGFEEGTEFDFTAGDRGGAAGVDGAPVAVTISQSDEHEPGGSALPDVARVDVGTAFALWKAGAVQVSGHSAVARDADGFVALGRVAADRAASVSLSIVGGGATYDRGGVPVVELVGLVAATSEHPGVDSVRLLTQPSRLEIWAPWSAGSAEVGQLVEFLEGQAAAAQLGQPVAFTVTDPGGVATASGWVSGLSPPEPVPHPLPLPESVAPWPEDPSAPPCGGDDLELTWAGSDAAMGQRRGGLRGRNVSGHPCAVEGVPAVEPLRGDGQPQAEVTTEPFRPGVVPARVVIPPGESAVVAIEWRMMSARNESDSTTAVRVVPVPGASATEVLVDGQLDILDGAVLAVSPWAQGIG